MGFEASVLDLLRDEEEIEIETTGASGARHRAIIWVVVDEQDRVLIRSYRGAGARWYREVTARPACRLLVAGLVVSARAASAAGPERVAACSDGLRRKYAGQPSMPPMVRQHLETTLELVAG
jgi:hypothetical protein